MSASRSPSTEGSTSCGNSVAASESDGGSGSGCKKLTWTADEDAELTRVLTAAGARRLDNGNVVLRGSWGEVASHLPGRSAKQCRERWRFNLCPGINRGDWTVEEDGMLLRQQLALGNQWALIARHLEGRTENGVKIRFKSLLRAARRVWTAQDDERLLYLHTLVGSRWGHIADKMPNRTRNGVKTRCLMLRNGICDKPPAEGAAEQLFKSAAFAALVNEFIDRSGVRRRQRSAADADADVDAEANTKADGEQCTDAATSMSPVPAAQLQRRIQETATAAAGGSRKRALPVEQTGMSRLAAAAGLSKRARADSAERPSAADLPDTTGTTSGTSLSPLLLSQLLSHNLQAPCAPAGVLLSLATLQRSVLATLPLHAWPPGLAHSLAMLSATNSSSNNNNKELALAHFKAADMLT